MMSIFPQRLTFYLREKSPVVTVVQNMPSQCAADQLVIEVDLEPLLWNRNLPRRDCRYIVGHTSAYSFRRYVAIALMLEL